VYIIRFLHQTTTHEQERANLSPFVISDSTETKEAPREDGQHLSTYSLSSNNADTKVLTTEYSSYKQFVANMTEKMQDSEFLEDTNLLLRPEVQFSPEIAYQLVYDRLIDRMEEEYKQCRCPFLKSIRSFTKK
jgi:hypothetical protein